MTALARPTWMRAAAKGADVDVVAESLERVRQARAAAGMLPGGRPWPSLTSRARAEGSLDPVVFGTEPRVVSAAVRQPDRECGKCGAAWRGEAPCWACGSEAVAWPE
jgi:hypothetical protein